MWLRMLGLQRKEVIYKGVGLKRDELLKNAWSRKLGFRRKEVISKGLGLKRQLLQKKHVVFGVGTEEERCDMKGPWTEGETLI